jgi:hypothetical protein
MAVLEAAAFVCAARSRVDLVSDLTGGLVPDLTMAAMAMAMPIAANTAAATDATRRITRNLAPSRGGVKPRCSDR